MPAIKDDHMTLTGHLIHLIECVQEAIAFSEGQRVSLGGLEMRPVRFSGLEARQVVARTNWGKEYELLLVPGQNDDSVTVYEHRVIRLADHAGQAHTIRTIAFHRVDSVWKAGQSGHWATNDQVCEILDK